MKTQRYIVVVEAAKCSVDADDNVLLRPSALRQPMYEISTQKTTFPFWAKFSRLGKGFIHSRADFSSAAAAASLLLVY